MHREQRLPAGALKNKSNWKFNFPSVKLACQDVLHFTELAITSLCQFVNDTERLGKSRLNVRQNIAAVFNHFL